MKVMTWNIRTGGGARLDAIVTVLNRERPDLLALQELRDFDRDNERRMTGIAGALGMTAHLAPSVFGQPVAVLARPPLALTRPESVRWRLHHAAAAAVVPTGRGPLTLVSTHLNPFAPYRRMREARWLGARYRSRGELVLLCGDLNALDPGTDHTAELAGLPGAYRHRHRAPDGSPDTRAMAAFAEAGFTDLWTVAGSGDGRTAPTTRGGGAEFSGMRLDYLLGSPAVAARATGARVVRGAEGEYASDHYPVTVQVDL